jgi:hypothetical protein
VEAEDEDGEEVVEAKDEDREETVEAEDDDVSTLPLLLTIRFTSI